MIGITLLSFPSLFPPSSQQLPFPPSRLSGFVLFCFCNRLSLTKAVCVTMPFSVIHCGIVSSSESTHLRQCLWLPQNLSVSHCMVELFCTYPIGSVIACLQAQSFTLPFLVILFRFCLISQYLVPKMCDIIKKSLINQFQGAVKRNSKNVLFVETSSASLTNV